MKSAYCKYIAALLLFGSNGIVASRISLASCEIVLLRTLLGSLFLLAIFGMTNRTFAIGQRKRPFFYLSLSGMAMGASWMLLYEAYRQVGVSVASLLYYCGPVIVMALSPWLFQERLTWLKTLGFLVVFCGILLVNGPTLQAGASGWGLVCGGLSAVAYALMVIFNKKAQRITGLENAMFQLLVSFLTVAAFVGWRQGVAFPVAGGDWPAILALGLLNTGVGCYLYFSSIGALPVQTVAVCGYLEPLSAVVFSFLFLHETMQPLQTLGAALMIAGAATVECIAPKLASR